MTSEGYSNHATSATELSDNFHHMNKRGAPTSNTRNRNFSEDPGQHVGKPFIKTNFYEDEYKKMVLEMDKEELPQDEKPVDPFEELLQLSVLADEGFQSSKLSLPPVTPIWNKPRPSHLSINSLLRWKRYKDEKHELVMAVIKKLEQQDMELFRSRQLHWKKSIVNVIRERFDNVGVGEYNFHECARTKSYNVKRKEKITRNLPGVCHKNRQDYNSETQKVFLGGLPRLITSQKLVWELKKKGYKVINKPKVFPRYSPEVCLGSAEEAQLMLQKKTIIIDGCTVDVRPFKTFKQKKMDSQLEVNQRSVFLEGIPSVMTVRVVITEIEKLGLKVTNHQLARGGCITKVTLATIEQAKRLIAQSVIEIDGFAVNVRPYMLS